MRIAGEVPNQFGVYTNGERSKVVIADFHVGTGPRPALSRAEALNLLAWLRVLVDPSGVESDELMLEIQKRYSIERRMMELGKRTGRVLRFVREHPDRVEPLLERLFAQGTRLGIRYEPDLARKLCRR